LLLTWVTTILPRYLPGNSNFYVPLGVINHTAISLRRVEAVKLDRLGEDFLAGIRVSRLKGSVTNIKSCILLVQFLTVPDTFNLIVNITE